MNRLLAGIAAGAAIAAVYFLAIYGLPAYGGEERTVLTSSLSESREAIEPQSDVTDTSSRRAA